jgi:protein involved in polysaccharide export with SLBB domain
VKRPEKKRGTMALLRVLMGSVCIAVGVSQVAMAQVGSPQNPPAATSSSSADRPIRDQQQDATSRVAAPAEEIRAVLVKDPGLLIELERLVEQEALAKGQLVEDTDLTQQAIFDRLDQDVAFRAAATRLVQRYGYLLPTVNPDSEMAKQQDLVLKERARRIVQIEAQEDAESMQPRQNQNQQQELASETDCDSRSRTNCRDAAPRRSRQDSSTTPGGQAAPPSEAPPFLSPSPQLNGAPLIQTRSTNIGLSNGGNGSDSADLLRMAATNISRDPGSLQASPDILERFLSATRDNEGNSDENPAPGGSAPESDINYSRDVPSARKPVRNSASDSPDGNIVHERSPYADVPSLADLYVHVFAHERKLQHFGVDILTRDSRDSTALPMDLPAGPDYVVGPGDGLAIDFWGGISQRLQRTVDSEGRISLPEYGPILVSGKSLGEVQLTVQQLMRTQLRDVSTDVSLSRLRTVRVYVVGDVADPGAYDVSSLSSPLNALVAAGGPTERGSLRSIKHFRGKQLIEVVDAYDLLLRGAGPDQKRLENGDSLLVPPLGPQVTIDGMVRRPAIYELRGTTSLEDALELAGGILPAAALKHVEVERIVAHENRTMLSLDLSGKNNEADSQLKTFQIQDGDRIHIFPIAPYNDKAIYLQGHVLRPGRYSYKEGMTVRDLVASYSDLLPEPAGQYAEIIRLNAPDYRPSVESFDLAAALANPESAPKLQPLDTVRIFGKYDFQAAPQIYVDGEVRAPGRYTASGEMHFRDAIYQAGGITLNAAMDAAQIIRTETDGTTKVLGVDLRQALAGQPAENLILAPNDRIVVHRSATKTEPPAVYVEGDVPNPGRYPLTSDMRVDDLLRLAGGLKPSADTQSAVLTHHEGKQPGSPQLQTAKLNLEGAMAGHDDDNRLLANGDVLTVRENPGWNDLGATVTIRGEVEHPGTYGIRPGEPLSSVLQEAGGFTDQAYPYGTVLTRREVRDLELKSREELVARLKSVETELKALPENDADQKNQKLTAIAQNETALTQLETHLPVGRVVMQGTLDEKSFDRSAGATPLRNGDVILVPKKPNYIVVQGQVFNATAVGFVRGRSANWYLGEAGGFTELADKKAVFVIRADGSVLAAKNNRGMWSGDPMDAVLMPGDVIVVPEKAPKVGSRNFLPLMQSAQVATSVALAVAYLKP